MREGWGDLSPFPMFLFLFLQIKGFENPCILWVMGIGIFVFSLKSSTAGTAGKAFCFGIDTVSVRWVRE